MRRLALCLVGVAAVATALVPPAAARGDGWSTLQRPLHLPHITPGAACPVSHADRSVHFDRFGIARGIGPGPAYPIGLAHGVLVVVPSSEGGVWAGQKVLWFVRPRYRGPVLVRGRRLDGPGLVRFGRGVMPAAELRLPAGTGEQPSFTRLRSLGCYAYQIDGVGFSRVIVFRATGRLGRAP
jgi:hypothetical protein